MALDENRLPLDKYMPPFDKWPLNYWNNKPYALVNRFGYYGLTYNTNHLTSEECQIIRHSFRQEIERQDRFV